MKPNSLALEPLRPRLPDFWWSEVVRIQAMIAEDAEAASFEAAYLEHAAEALAQAEDDQLAHQHAPALWAASHQLKALALARMAARRRTPRSARTARGAGRARTLAALMEYRGDPRETLA